MRRCKFLDELPAYNYNQGAGEVKVLEDGRKIYTSTDKLGSTLMNTMLDEVAQFCSSAFKKEWSENVHNQVRNKILEC